MLKRMLDLLPFGCRHARLTVPFSTDTGRRGQAHLDCKDELPHDCSHYVVCLECGRRFGYDWNSMKVIKTRLNKAV